MSRWIASVRTRDAFMTELAVTYSRSACATAPVSSARTPGPNTTTGAGAKYDASVAAVKHRR
ncbi:MAG: hypothetical protein J07HQW1_00815 [Haloquadratum walsbyi J07HQW1]|uniref:Uncharacterized protein n=1 Tax=Haloquadratum walsbyi J07HQW1 TaxID=1238424 RepID=U1PB58_9EURY|nr:MAG: hypothetical protein J07HQW1_00815 [Haloquadratum walsbyi J07HQW1]